MTSSFRGSLAELDDALAVERDMFDRVRFTLVVMLLIREGGRVSEREEARRRLEQAVNAVHCSAAPHLRMIEELAGNADTPVLARLVDMAEEPYRTMLADHVAWFTAMAAELDADRTFEKYGSAGANQLERELEAVLYRAVRAALSRGVGIILARYLRGGIRGDGSDDA